MRLERRNGRDGYDIIVQSPVGEVRERRAFPAEVRSESARRRWTDARALLLATKGRPDPDFVPAPTLREFGARWMRDHVRAEGLKPSTVDAYERILRLHLYPPIGSARLDEIGEIQVQRVKLHIAGKSEKTRAGVLALLAEILGAAERWDEIVKAPRIELPRFMQGEMAFYDFADWQRLIAGARRAGPMQLAAILLGGDAGLRRGELVALEQRDIGPDAVTVQRSEWQGEIGKPKGGKIRRVPMTERLRAAIGDVRHLRGARLLWQESGRRVGIATLQSWLEVASKRAGLPESRNLHRLRHTFCSHLAMRGAPARAIQDLAGHADLKTTMRYMHLAAGSAEAAIALLDGARGPGVDRAAKNGTP